MSKQERAAGHFSINESLLFEEGSPGRRAFDLSPLEVPLKQMGDLMDPELLRCEIDGMPELSELDVFCHFTRLSSRNYHIDLVPYPLGSCRSRYNPKINGIVARLEGSAFGHAY